ncbi:carbohydrate ABC transporter substrate-binding protein (CUT1 family) [Paenibacillus taihuensis]|uniref:Carbohydrate ABC transporter substrate-binding protein (CUT1 family) n=1 Tax=Paenibacillus taihuensis TaxID=1156355 RepID=A0A3D9QVD0_9BACL|nr:extracellular solute-binding protein [Paenibacillus taihuensis]REE68057.1 carbohydrate ABC transporter substrate-binding protein (CUT1 family) [Paenibacillus taihuensis]
MTNRTRRTTRLIMGSGLLAITFNALLLSTGCSPSEPAPIIETKEKQSLIRFVAAEYSSETKPLLEEIVRQFEIQNPTIEVELQVANWDILGGIYTAMISKNQPPDLLNSNAYAQFASDGLLNNMGNIMSPELKQKIYPNLLEKDRMGNVQYAVPYVASVRNMYYNQDLFDAAGIEAPPKTWSELKAAAGKIVKTGKATGFGVDLTDNETQAYLSYFFLGSGGGWIKDGKWTINSPENVQGLTFLKELYDAKLTDPEPTVTTRDEKQRVLGDGKLGMLISGNYFTSVVPREFPNLRFGVGPIPVKDGHAPLSFGVQDVLVSFKNDHTDTAALSKFLDFLYDDGRYEEFTRREGLLPVTSTVGQRLASNNPVMQNEMAALEKAEFYPIQEPAWQAVMDTARKLGDAVLFSRMTPKQALDELQHFAETHDKK